jgi:uncharacterized protein YjbI with pentapeptide repeats
MFLKLTKLIMSNCEIKESDFIGAEIPEADFHGSNLEKSIFSKTNLFKADFRNSRNFSIDFKTNNIKKARFLLTEAVTLLNNLDIIIEN